MKSDTISQKLDTILFDKPPFFFVEMALAGNRAETGDR